MAKEVTPEQIEMLDGMVAKARAAAEIIATYDQERVDRLCQAVAASVIDMKVWANLADEAVDETGLGEDAFEVPEADRLFAPPTPEEAEQVIARYLGHAPTGAELRHYIGYVAMASYFWFLWGLYQEACAKHVGEYLYIWYKYTKQYARLTLERYDHEEEFA